MAFEATKYLSGARQLVKALETQLNSISDYSSPALDKIGGGRSGIPCDRVSKLIIRKEKLTEKLAYMLEACFDLEEASAAELDTVNDPGLRAIIIWRYVYDMAWSEIARECGGGTTEDAVKKRFERSMKAYDKQGGAVSYPPNALLAVQQMKEMLAKAQISDRKELKKTSVDLFNEKERQKAAAV